VQQKPILSPTDVRIEAHRLDEETQVEVYAEITSEVPLNLGPEKGGLHCLERFGKTRSIARGGHLGIIEISWPCSHT